jgi:hypothetical protein
MDMLLDCGLVYVCQQWPVRGLPLFGPDGLHLDGLATSLDCPLALAGDLLHGGLDDLHALLGGIWGIFIGRVHTVMQVLLTDALQVIRPPRHPQPRVGVGELAGLDGLLGFCLGLGLLPCLNYLIDCCLDRVSWWWWLAVIWLANIYIMGPFSGWEKLLAGDYCISLLDYNLGLLPLMVSWAAPLIWYFPPMMLAPMVFHLIDRPGDELAMSEVLLA